MLCYNQRAERGGFSIRIRSLPALVLALCVLSSMAFAQEGLHGYTAEQGHQYLLFGGYPQEERGEAKPIVWKVLGVQDGLAYLMSEKILDVRRVSGDQWNYKGWESSELYAWLNEDFLQAAFSMEELKALHGDEILGFVSLPSVEDLQSKALGFGTDLSRRIYGTPYALTQRGLYSYSSRGYSPIWTRTPSQQTHAQRATKINGKIGFIGVESDDLGVCPVVWLKLDSVGVIDGDGSQAAPYILQAQEGKQP